MPLAKEPHLKRSTNQLQVMNQSRNPVPARMEPVKSAHKSHLTLSQRTRRVHPQAPYFATKITDCDGNCISEQHTSLIADGFCDDHTGLINFNCQAFDFDGGDCSQEPSSIEEVESPRDLGVKPTVEFTWSILPDFYQDEIAWEIYTYDGLFSLYAGNPTNSPLTQGIALEKGSYCFSVYDSFGDGGSSGQLFVDGVLWHMGQH